MPKKIFIGGLSAQTTEADLQGLCRELEGLTSLQLGRDEDGSPRCVAEFASDEAGTAALRRIQGQSLNGQPVRVSEGR